MYGAALGIRASILGYLKRVPEAKTALDAYLTRQPNLETRDNYHKSFITHSLLAGTIVEGLRNAGWEPED